MASVKVKFRPSTIEGKEGTIYYQIIQNRVIRQLKTDYRIFTTIGSGFPPLFGSGARFSGCPKDNLANSQN